MRDTENNGAAIPMETSKYNEEILLDTVSSKISELLAKQRAGTLTAEEKPQLERLAAFMRIDLETGGMTETSQLSKEDRMRLGRAHAKLYKQQNTPNNHGNFR